MKDLTKLIKLNLMLPPKYRVKIPKSPNKKDDEYHKKYRNWFETYLNKIETQMTKFRDDNWLKSSE